MFKKVSKELLNLRLLPILQIRTSKWAKDFVEPIVTKNELEEIKVTDQERYSKLVYNRVKSLDPFKNNNEFFDPFIYKMVGRVLRKGARERADKLIRETLFLIKKDRLEKCRKLDPETRENFNRNPIEIFKEAWNNCKPILKVTEVVRGGSKYYAPVPVLEEQKDKIVFSWVREVIENRPRPRPEKFPQVFSKEILLAYKNEGKLIKKKLDLYRLCEANKAYVNYVYMQKKVAYKK